MIGIVISISQLWRELVGIGDATHDVRPETSRSDFHFKAVHESIGVQADQFAVVDENYKFQEALYSISSLEICVSMLTKFI